MAFQNLSRQKLQRNYAYCVFHFNTDENIYTRVHTRTHVSTHLWNPAIAAPSFWSQTNFLIRSEA